MILLVLLYWSLALATPAQAEIPVILPCGNALIVTVAVVLISPLIAEQLLASVRLTIR